MQRINGIGVWLLWGLMLLALILSLPARAGGPQVLGQTILTLDDGQLSLLEDREGSIELAEAMKRHAAGEFRPIPHGIGEGYSHSAFWAHAELVRPADVAAERAFSVSPSYLDWVDLYVVQNGRLLNVYHTGDQVSHADSQAAHNRLHIVKAQLPEGKFDLYIHLRTTSTSALLLKLVPLDKLVAHVDGRVFMEGVLIGILLTVLIINLINGLWLKRALFLYFVAYELALVFTVLLSTSTLRAFFPGITAGEQNLWMMYSILIAGLLAYVFFYRLLDFSYRTRRWVEILFAIGFVTSLNGIVQTAQDNFTGAMYYINNYVVVFPWLVSLLLLPYWRAFDEEQRYRASGFLAFGIFCSINSLYVSGFLGVTSLTSYVAPVMILSFQLSLHFIIMLSVRKSEKILSEARRKAEVSGKEVELERSQRLAHEMFMAMFSHEVRTPLAVIDTAAQSLTVLERKQGGAEQRQQRYQRIRDAVARINELLQMSLVRGRLEQTEGREAAVAYDVAQLISSVVQEFSEQSRKRLDLQGVAACLEVRLNVPPALLVVVMRNLIDNALKYSPVDTQVEVSANIVEQQLVLSVRDHGQGMTGYAQQRMFERYFRASEREDVPGLGLGLFVVKEVVDRYDGRIEVETGAEGTCLTCYFAERCR